MKTFLILIICLIIFFAFKPKLEAKNVIAEMTGPGMYIACTEEECAICKEDDMPPWEALEKCIGAVK